MFFKNYFLIFSVLLYVSASSNFRYHNRLLSARSRARLEQKDDCRSGLCNTTTFYPKEKVRRIVDHHPSFHSFLQGKVFEPVVETVGVFSRSGQEMQSFCKTVDVTVAPKLMFDVENVKRRIVNLEKYNQILKFQTCESEGKEDCFEEVILNLKTKCEQRFNTIKLLTVDVNKELLEYRSFRIPTTCVCTYARDFEYN